MLPSSTPFSDRQWACFFDLVLQSEDAFRTTVFSSRPGLKARSLPFPFPEQAIIPSFGTVLAAFEV
jgi:hypothetical protein